MTTGNGRNRTDVGALDRDTGNAMIVGIDLVLRQRPPLAPM